jgi:uncharacterized protein YraI
MPMNLFHRKLIATGLMLAILAAGWTIRPVLSRQATPVLPDPVAVPSLPGKVELAASQAIRGQVLLQGRSDYSGVDIFVDGWPATTTNRDGAFSVAGLAPGPHLVVAQTPGYLAASSGEIELEAGQVADLAVRPVTLLAGDVNGDGRVNVFDLALVSGGSPVADLNADGQVNLLDLVLVTGNYGRSAPIAWPIAGQSRDAAGPPRGGVLGDVDGDGVVGNSDLVIVAGAYGSKPPSDPRADVNQDGEVNLADLLVVAANFGATGMEAAAETALQAATPTPTPATTGAPSCSVTAYALNVRSGPGTVYPVLTAVRRDTALEIIARDRGGFWIQVRTPDPIEGWVASAFVTCNVAISEIGVAESIPPAPFTPTPVVQPTQTPHVAILYPAPALISPNDGDTFDKIVKLEWYWSGVLGPDEHFDVQVWRPGEQPRGVAWSDTNSWSGPLLGPRGARLWRIVVIRGRNGQWEANLSAPSETRFFNYRLPRSAGREEQATPGPAATATPQGAQPTDTPVPPVETVAATNTPVPPTATTEPTGYPEQPTNTPEPTGYPATSMLPTTAVAANWPAPGAAGQLPLVAVIPGLGLVVGYRLRRRQR